jgi:hypothetical protein
MKKSLFGKRLFISFMFIFLISLVPIVSASPTLWDNLTHYYSFDTQVDNNFEDLKNSSWNMSSVTNPTKDGGKINNYIACNGSNLSLVVQPSGSAQTSYHSVSFWMYANNSPAGLYSVVTGYDLLGTGQDWRIFTSQYSNEIYIEINPSTFFVTNYTLTYNNWVHVVYTSTSGSHNVYVNGELVGIITSGVSRTLSGNISNIICGQYQPSGYFFEGGIDELAYFDKILNSTEVQELYNNGSGLSYTNPIIIAPTYENYNQTTPTSESFTSQDCNQINGENCAGYLNPSLITDGNYTSYTTLDFNSVQVNYWDAISEFSYEYINGANLSLSYIEVTTENGTTNIPLNDFVLLDNKIKFGLVSLGNDLVNSPEWTETKSIYYPLLISEDTFPMYNGEVEISNVIGSGETRQQVFERSRIYDIRLIWIGTNLVLPQIQPEQTPVTNTPIYQVMDSAGAGMGTFIQFISQALPLLILILIAVGIVITIGYAVAYSIKRSLK